jgi:hypothetical protein
MPPVPAENRSPKGTGSNPDTVDDAEKVDRHENRNLEQQGRQGNIHQNTHNQGHQQDR